MRFELENVFFSERISSHTKIEKKKRNWKLKSNTKKFPIALYNLFFLCCHSRLYGFMLCAFLLLSVNESSTFFPSLALHEFWFTGPSEFFFLCRLLLTFFLSSTTGSLVCGLNGRQEFILIMILRGSKCCRMKSLSKVGKKKKKRFQ